MSTQDEDTIDFREIDKVLTEAAGIAGRWGLFRKFLFDRLRVSGENEHIYN